MAERRQAARREPIEVEVADGRVFTAHPLPWMQANDLGQEIVEQNVKSANDLVKMWIDDAGLPEIQMQFRKKIYDWQSVIKIAFPNEPAEKWVEPHALAEEEIAEVVLASVDVNNLGHLRHLVDPNFQPPTNPGGTSSSTETEGASGEKTPSTPDSGSPALPEPTPLI